MTTATLEAISHINETFATLGHKGLEKRTTVQFNRRYRRTLGTASFALDGNGLASMPVITLASHAWKHCTPSERREIAVHEACHIICRMRHGHDSSVKAHGKEWRALMAAMGYETAGATLRLQASTAAGGGWVLVSGRSPRKVSPCESCPLANPDAYTPRRSPAYELGAALGRFALSLR